MISIAKLILEIKQTKVINGFYQKVTDEFNKALQSQPTNGHFYFNITDEIHVEFSYWKETEEQMGMDVQFIGFIPEGEDEEDQTNEEEAYLELYSNSNIGEDLKDLVNNHSDIPARLLRNGIIIKS